MKNNTLAATKPQRPMFAVMFQAANSLAIYAGQNGKAPITKRDAIRLANSVPGAQAVGCRWL